MGRLTLIADIVYFTYNLGRFIFVVVVVIVFFFFFYILGDRDQDWGGWDRREPYKYSKIL